jgi:hypothetical protein
MKQGHCCGTANGGRCGRQSGRDKKTDGPADVAKRKLGAKPLLEQPSYQYGLASIAKALKYRGQKVSVTQEVGSDSADHHTNNER